MSNPLADFNDLSLFSDEELVQELARRATAKGISQIFMRDAIHVKAQGFGNTVGNPHAIAVMSAIVMHTYREYSCINTFMSHYNAMQQRF